MAQPIQVAYDALTKDAATWDAVGDALETAQTEVADIHLHRGAFSFAAMDLADQYLALHARIGDLLAEGAQNTRDGAAALRAVRDDFLRYEDATQSEFSGLWQPIL
jgi:hypothetical protein